MAARAYDRTGIVKTVFLVEVVAVFFRAALTAGDRADELVPGGNGGARGNAACAAERLAKAHTAGSSGALILAGLKLA
jgi:hypothetical protein